MSSILNLADRLATGILSRSSQDDELSDALNYLIRCSIGSMHEYPQILWSVLLQVRQPQNDHVIDKVAMNHKASHPELQVVYSTDCPSLV